MGRKRRAHPSFEWQHVLEEGEDPRPGPNIRIKHTRFDLDESGPSSSRTTYLSAPASPTKLAPPIYDNFNWNDNPAPPELNIKNYPFLDPAYQHFLDINEPGPPRRKRTTEVSHCNKYLSPRHNGLSLGIQDDPLRRWCDKDRDRYLRELICLDGRGEDNIAAACGFCKVAEPKLRCEECFGGLMFCAKCMVDMHASNPLHRIEVRISYSPRC
jgi:hypothetical protein